MTILYMTELTVDSSDFADFLRADDTYVSFVTHAEDVEDWADNTDTDEIAVVFDAMFAKEAKKLQGRFVVVEQKPDMDVEDIFDAIKQAAQKLSPRKSLQ
jgi:hypothetical protein